MADNKDEEVFVDTEDASRPPSKRKCLCSDGAKDAECIESGSLSAREKMKAEMMEEMRNLMREEMRADIKDVIRETMKELMKDVVKEEMKVVLGVVRDIEETVRKVERKVDSMEEQMKRQTDEVKCVKKEVSDMKDEVSEVKEDISVYKERLEKVEERMIDQNARSRRNNMVFNGFPETGGKEDCFKMIREAVEKCGVKGQIGIDRAHRIPTGVRPAGSKPRPVICHFIDYSVKQEVKKAKRHLPSGIRVSDDLPPEIREARRQLTPALEKARAENKDAFVAYPARLIIDNVEVMKIRPGTTSARHGGGAAASTQHRA